MADIDAGGGGSSEIVFDPNNPNAPGPPMFIWTTTPSGIRQQIENPAYDRWRDAKQAWLNQVARNGGKPPPTPGGETSGAGPVGQDAGPSGKGPGPYVPPGSGNHQVVIGGYVYIVDGNGNIVSYVGPANTGNNNSNPQVSYQGGGGGGGMTAYEAAQIELDKQKLAQAEAQQKADEAYRQAQALDAFNKNWQDFQTKNYYGSISGPAYAAPAGAPNWWKMPEPDYVANYYKNNPNAGPDPWNQPNPYSGYSGSLFSNPQQPGTQQTPPQGSLGPAVAAGQGQGVQGPIPGVTSGALPGFDPNASQSGQNVPTSPVLGGIKPPIPPVIDPGVGKGPLPVQSMAMGGQSPQTALAIVHGGEQVVEPKTIGATSIPIPPKKPTPALATPSYNPGYPIPGMADGGTVPGQPGQPQLAALPAGTDVIPGGNFSQDNPSPVANAGPESMNPIIKQLLGAVNAIITSPEFQSAVYTKPPIAGDMGSDDLQTPGSAASGWPPDPSTYDPTIYRPGSVPGTWMNVMTGRAGPGPVSSNIPASGSWQPKPIGGSRPLPGPVQGGGLTPPPISAQAAAKMSGVVAGPAAINHVPYGPELTGMSGFGGLITPNGTPVVASEWQRQHLDPTSITRYENYAGTIAGVNPADLRQQSDLMTGVLNENSPTIKAPIKFDLSNQIPVPGQGGG